jgi:Pyruvate/2-oxoacid:ferredoxin oxidoreductase delta subunit
MWHFSILSQNYVQIFQCVLCLMLCGEGRVHTVYKVPCYLFFMFNTVFYSFSLQFFLPRLFSVVKYITDEDFESPCKMRVWGYRNFRDKAALNTCNGNPCFSNWTKINRKINFADANAHKLNPLQYFLIFLFIANSIFKHFCLGCELAATDCLLPKLIF